MKESIFQREIIEELKNRFPNCIILKNDANYKQGIPDLTVLFGDKWACLEVKISNKANKQPNQGYWVEKMDKMSYAAFIYPENKEEVFNELEKTFST